MTLDDLLTLTLPQRIIWLHGRDGPKGKLSHDKFADAIGIPNRQTIINWEKPGGTEPTKENAERLEEFSGFPWWAFRRAEAEEAVHETFGRRLGRVEARVDQLAELTARGEAGRRALRELQPLAATTPEDPLAESKAEES